MPTSTVTLSDKEVRMACRYWVECGCPMEVEARGVNIHVTPGSNDPRESPVPTVSATVDEGAWNVRRRDDD